ncbi:SDR family oxidoreductase [Kutzneria sp. 744]|uniref:SDR family oxidoreductase n=1 Tax=Kutzneria sp. (strain 744) TaxID=345341 RepID=UPI0005BA3F30|nr:SDR family oxidoreductase [Kutzneria sp. 744]
MPWPTPYPVPDQTGRLAIVTGASSGTGAEIARRLAMAGGEVVLAVRDVVKGEGVRDRILGEEPAGKLTVAHLDLADLNTVRPFADRFDRPIDLLVNNAGVLAPPKRMVTKDGFELQFGTNFLGPFALTVGLLPQLLRADRPRVATMSSAAAVQGRLVLDDLQSERRYSPFGAYGTSKLADLIMAKHLARIAAAHRWPLLSVVAHPGSTRTNLDSGRDLGRDRPRTRWFDWRSLFPKMDVAEGVEPLLVAATSPDAVNGEYYGPSGRFEATGAPTIARLPARARDIDLAARLWAAAESLTGATLRA